MSIVQILTSSLLFAVCLAALLQAVSVRSFAARACVASLCMGLTVRYAAWRVANMPAPALAFGALWPWTFGLLELAALGYEAWTALVLIRRPDHTREADSYEVRLRSRSSLPSVDIFVATYNEPTALLEQTILAALALEYPPGLLRVILCDDGEREEMRLVAARLGIDYLARPRLPGGGKLGGRAKGGNDRYAFSMSSGEVILLLDADFRLRPQFLYRTLGFLLFRNDVGLVQTPQRFLNSDPVSENLLAGRYAPDDQHFFMAVGEPSRDGFGNAFSTGTACVLLRRVARYVDEQWGFPDSTITEDLELSYALLNHGFRTLYLNEALAYGLAPESVLDFIKQRVRWCAGTVQNLYARTGPFRGRLRWLDRLFYCEGVLYWAGSIFIVALMLAGPVFWFTGVSAVLGTSEEAAHAALPYLVAREVAMYWRSEGKIPPVLVNIRRVLPAFHVSVAFFKALLSPKSPVFGVSVKGQTRDRCVVRWGPFTLFAALASVSALSMILGLAGRTPASYSTDLIQLNALWTAVSAVVAVLCALACVDLPLDNRSDGEVVRSSPARIGIALANRMIFGVPAHRQERKHE